MAGSLERVFWDASFEHSCECIEGLPPALRGLALDQLAGRPALVARHAPLSVAGPSPLVLDVDDGQPDQLDDRVVGRELPPILDDLADLVIERLDRYLEPCPSAGP